MQHIGEINTSKKSKSRFSEYRTKQILNCYDLCARSIHKSRSIVNDSAEIILSTFCFICCATNIFYVIGMCYLLIRTKSALKSDTELESIMMIRQGTSAILMSNKGICSCSCTTAKCILSRIHKT